MTDKPIALVTGGNRGLGRETVRQLAARGYRVLLGSRDPKLGESVAASIEGDVSVVEFDVTSDDHMAALRARVEREGRLDALVNCAGIIGRAGYDTSTLDLEMSDLRQVLDVNVGGAIRVSAAVVPLMKQRGQGCVVNVSSGMGQLSEMNTGAPCYRLSKTALNAFSRILSQELAATRIKVNSVCPGWVRTDMGGENASLGVEEGAQGIVWAATLPSDGPSGGFFRHGKRIDW